VYDQKFIDFLDKKGVGAGSTWNAGYSLMNEEGWTQSETETFIQAAIPTYSPGLWG
jgi:hypothetical protein